MNIDVSKYTAHKHPGKFEGETPATEYFYEQMCDGTGEFIGVYTSADGEEYDDPPSAVLFQIAEEEATAFNLPIGHWFLLREDSQGFAIGSVYETREAAEREFERWVRS